MIYDVLVFDSFDWKIGVFQQTVIGGFMLLLNRLFD